MTSVCLALFSTIFSLTLEEQELIHTSDGDAISGSEVLELFKKEDFERLEYIAAELRKSKEKNAAGAWHLNSFYGYAPEDPRQLEGESEAAVLESFRRWKEAYPNSVTWRLFLAGTYNKIAWRHRGTGFASSVTDEGFKGFRDYLIKEWELLVEVEALPEKDPALYAAAHEAALGLGRLAVDHLQREDSTAFGFKTGDTGRDLMQRIFEAGVKVEPLYPHLYDRRARSLLYRWGGKRGELEAFADDAVNRTKDLVGNYLYFRVFWNTLSQILDSEALGYYQFDWSKLDKGYEDAIALYPDTPWYPHHYTYVACLFEKREKARELFASLDGFYSSVWNSESQYEAFRDWATGDGEYPWAPELEIAILRDQDEELKRLLKAGADPNLSAMDGISLLRLAIRDSNSEAVSALLEAGADVERAASDEYSNLYWALRGRKWEIASLLLDAGASVTAMAAGAHIARDESGEILAFLLKEGVDSHQVNQYGGNFLLMSALTGNATNIRMLIEHGMDVNSTVEVTGETPLYFAVAGGHTKAVKVLLDHDPDLKRRYTDDFTVLEIAQIKGFPEIYEILERAMKGESPC